MDAQYVYTKLRSEFGRHCQFIEEGPRSLFHIKPDKLQFEMYIPKSPVHRYTSCVKVFSAHEMNTEAAKYEEHGMNHAEGSWPKNVNPNDPEETQRFRDKQMKDETYLQTVRAISEPMEHYILQNNTVNIYDDYYGGVEFQSLDKMASARKLNVFRDCVRPERPISHISWAPEGTLMAVAHCNMRFGALVKNTDTTSYIWDVENPDSPFRRLSSPKAITCMEFNPKDPHTLMSGLATGEVGVWDIRDSAALALSSTLLYSHRAPVASVQIIHSKTGNEFFTTSYDGQVLWWDMRALSEPTEKLILDSEKGEQDISRALGASVLEYEPTIPTQFMVGTQMGEVISCNRKMKTPAEMIVAKYAAHRGPVVALHRNQALLKNFLTVGDWSAKIWVGECKTSAIVWTKYHPVRLTGGYWSPTRFSVFFTTKEDGTLDVWDILKSTSDPYLRIKVCDEPLTCLRVHDQGLHVAVGNSVGTVNLVELSENLADAPKKERPILATMLERECHREKILDAKVREQKLKQKLRGKEEESKMAFGPSQEEAKVEKAEKNFFDTIGKELGGKGELEEIAEGEYSGEAGGAGEAGEAGEDVEAGEAGEAGEAAEDGEEGSEGAEEGHEAADTHVVAEDAEPHAAPEEGSAPAPPEEAKPAE